MPQISLSQAEFVGIPAGMRAWDPELVDVLDTRLERARQYNKAVIYISDELAEALIQAATSTIIEVPPKTIAETGLDDPNFSPTESNRVARARGLVADIKNQRLEQSLTEESSLAEAA